MQRSSRSAFTLVELLIVIAVIAILSTVVVVILNPAQLLAQSRDANRVGDMTSLSLALADYQSQVHGSMGTTNTIYVSIPDPSATSTAGDQCQGLGLPAAPTGTVYQCAPPSTYKLTNGTGWIPLNLASITPVPPISALPADPTNTTSTNFYYTYAASGTQYEVAAVFESQKYKTQYGQAPIDPYYPEADVQGSYTLNSLFSSTGLVAYWPLNEGTGSSTADQSSNGNKGTWNGTPTNGSYYTSGKVGTYGGTFNGSNDYISVPATTIAGTFTVSAWVKPNSPAGFARIVENSYSQQFDLGMFDNATLYSFWVSGAEIAGGTPVNGTWQFVVGVYDGSKASLYMNGVLVAGPTSETPPGAVTDTIGVGGGPSGGSPFTGSIDDVRIYSRALSVAEIQALYNAVK